jgi:hypothetical protein
MSSVSGEEDVPALSPAPKDFHFGDFLVELFENYKTALRNAPLLTKSITSASIAMLGEIFGCFLRCKAKGEAFSIDSKRVGIFGLYGLLVTGPVLHFWYGLLESTLRKLNLTGYTKTIVKLLLDRCVFGPPFVLYTLFFLQFLQTGSVDKTLSYIRRSYTTVLILNEKIWTIAQAINFELVPVQYQVLFPTSYTYTIHHSLTNYTIYYTLYTIH